MQKADSNGDNVDDNVSDDTMMAMTKTTLTLDRVTFVQLAEARARCCVDS